MHRIINRRNHHPPATFAPELDQSPEGLFHKGHKVLDEGGVVAIIAGTVPTEEIGRVAVGVLIPAVGGLLLWLVAAAAIVIRPGHDDDARW